MTKRCAAQSQSTIQVALIRPWSMGTMVNDELDANVMNDDAEAAGSRLIDPGATPQTARDHLRNATAETHSRLHLHRAFSRLMSGSLTLPDYRQLLARLYGFHVSHEARLWGIPAQWCFGLDPLSHSKARLLGDDLAALNVDAGQTALLPVCRGLTAIGSSGAFVGCAYVIEGAGLGGRIMARRLDTLLGTGTAEGRRFFLSGPTSFPSRWSRCCDAVEQCADDGHIDAMVAAASDTFLALEGWLQGGFDAPIT
jgi:heme oxygenase (biliverdin-IX-beta and delta-forming)